MAARRIIATTIAIPLFILFMCTIVAIFTKLSDSTDKKRNNKQKVETDEKYTVRMSGIQVQLGFLVFVLGVMFIIPGFIQLKVKPYDWNNTKMFFIIGGAIIFTSLLYYLYTALWRIDVDGAQISIRTRHTFLIKKILNVNKLDGIQRTKMYHQLDIKSNGHRLALVNIASKNEEKLTKTLEKYSKYDESQEAIIQKVAEDMGRSLEKHWGTKNDK